MNVYIVFKEYGEMGDYDYGLWLEKAFSSLESAQSYVTSRSRLLKASYGLYIEEIEVEE